MPGLKTVKELRAEVERLSRLNARYRRELRAAKQRPAVPVPTSAWRKTNLDDVLWGRPGGVVEVPRELLEVPREPWHRRCWNWITGR